MDLARHQRNVERYLLVSAPERNCMEMIALQILQELLKCKTITQFCLKLKDSP